MVMVLWVRCTLTGLLFLALCFWRTDGLIEIVEEQRCRDYDFRLTCRELDSHIAVLEAWFTSVDDYYRSSNETRTHESIQIKTQNDSELNRVYVYSSPKHNGVYELTNHSSENITDVASVNVNSSLDYEWRLMNDSVGLLSDLNDTVDMSVDLLNVTDGCGVPTFSRSYASWHEGDKRRRSMSRALSINLRAPLSYRCTGVNHCSFVLGEDYPPSLTWSPGAVYIKYACFDDSLSVHYCNREVQAAVWGPDSEGYIRTPGYPHFYIGEECGWKLNSHPEQRIRVTLLDVSLRSIGPFEEECTDYVLVRDSNGEVLLSTCEQVDLPLRLTSVTNSVEVVVETKSKGAFPKRGVLLHYKSVGCVTLPAPSNGYLVYRNEDVAHYMCDVNHVFVDTRQRARVVWCYDDNRWNDTVPVCVEETTAKVVGNDSSPEAADKDSKLPHNEANMIVDIVIPSLLIAALFIGNAFIVLIIYKYRKRFYEKFNIPGVIGCIDGTLVSMVRPKVHEELYYCRKGYHARNVLLNADTPLVIEKNQEMILPATKSPFSAKQFGQKFRKTEDLEDEFNTIPLSVNGVHSAGNAV